MGKWDGQPCGAASLKNDTQTAPVWLVAMMEVERDGGGINTGGSVTTGGRNVAGGDDS